MEYSGFHSILHLIPTLIKLTNVYLFKVSQLNDINYEITEIPLKYLLHFNHIEKVMVQDEESKLHWIGLFNAV